jgi:hypothetical protein
MAEQACSLPPAVAPSPDPRTRDTGYLGRSSPATGSAYELQFFPGRQPEADAAHTDDGCHPSVSLTHVPSSPGQRAMSRAPLLVRSSPALGTGKLKNWLARPPTVPRSHAHSPRPRATPQPSPQASGLIPCAAWPSRTPGCLCLAQY